MKHSDEPVNRLSQLCIQSGVETPLSVLALLIEYLDAVLRANESVNLTRITAPEHALRLHLLDSLCAVPEVQSSPPGKMCDIGTGAGFPGVPIAAASGRECVLLDSVRKKADVVSGILADLSMNSSIAVSGDRAEQHARVHANQYSVVTARAVAPLPSLVELAAPLLVDGGVLVALKGDPSEAEYQSGLVAAKTVGLGLKSRRDYRLPEGDEQRCVIAYEKIGPASVVLPRREGLAQHSPLG